FGTQKLILRPDDPRDVLFGENPSQIIVASHRTQSLIGYPASLDKLRKQACALLAPGSDEFERSDLCAESEASGP
ncbi:MAG TPA: hypothetical protein PK472_07545, partial [Pseudomonadota bacterium]|nr:hypothetical protein [Pseudomonadota bacterium]